MTPRLAANLIRLIGWGFIIFGIGYVTIASPALDGLAKSAAVLFDWSGQTSSDTLSRSARWFAAIMSGLSAGFGALYVFVIAPLLTAGHLPSTAIARRGGLIAAGLWFAIDSTGSYAAGVPSNVVMNAVFLVMLSVPLIMVKAEGEAA